MGEVQLTIHSNFQEVIDKINKLDSSVDNLNKDIAESGKVSKQAYDTATREANQFNQAQQKNQQTLSKSMQMFAKFGATIGAAFSVTAVLAFGKAVITSTDAGADAMERFREGVKSAFTFLKQSLATMDFTNLIQGFRDAYQAGKDFADQMDEIEDRRRALLSQTKDIDLQIINQRTIARNRSLDLKDRQAAIEEIIRLEELKLKKTKDITEDELKTQLDYAATNKKLSNEEILDLVTNYDKYKEQLKEGAKLNEELIKLRNQAESESYSYAKSGLSAGIDAYNLRLSQLTETEKENLRLAVEYNKIGKEQRDIILATSNADKDATMAMASAEESLQRLRNGLYAEYLSNEKGKQEALEESEKLAYSIFLAELDRQNDLQKTILETEAAFDKLIETLSEEKIDLPAGESTAVLNARETYDIVMQLAKNTSEGQRAEIQKQIDALNEWRDTGIITASQFEEALAKLQKQYEETYTWAEQHPLWAAIGIKNQEELEQYKDYASQIFDVINDIVDQQVEASERLVDDMNQRIDEQEQLVNREFELKKEGLGNNYALEQENLLKMQQARDQAIKDREKNIRIQKTLSTIESSISLITAAANIMKGFSEIPIVGVILGIAAVGAMIASFIVSQSKIKDATQFAKGGQLKGMRHSEGGIPIPGTGIEVEGGEYVANRRSTQKYLPLLEAINKDDRDAMRLFFDRKFIQKMPAVASFGFDIDRSQKLGEIVRELKRGKSEIIYGNGFIIEKSGGYTKRINLN